MPPIADYEHLRRISQAAGVLMAEADCTYQAALEAIRESARRLRVAPLDIAAFVEWRGELPD